MPFADSRQLLCRMSDSSLMVNIPARKDSVVAVIAVLVVWVSDFYNTYLQSASISASCVSPDRRPAPCSTVVYSITVLIQDRFYAPGRPGTYGLRGVEFEPVHVILVSEHVSSPPGLEPVHDRACVATRYSPPIPLCRYTCFPDLVCCQRGSIFACLDAFA